MSFISGAFQWAHSTPVSARRGRGGFAGGVRAALGGLLMLSAAIVASAQTVYDVSTVAGVMPGSADGQGAAARFYSPAGLDVDAGGVLFVADTGNQTVRRVSPDGFVSTLLGVARQVGDREPSASNSRLSYPTAVAVDSAGNLYVAQFPGVYKFSTDGVVTRVLRSTGYIPAIVVDAQDNLYAVDAAKHQVWKVSAAGVAVRLAGSPVGQSGSADGTGDAARFDLPLGIAVTADGSVYISDTSNCTIRKVTPAGVVTTVAGAVEVSASTNGPAAAARFAVPRAMAADGAGNLYIADGVVVRKMTTAGVVSTLAGQVGSKGHADGTGAAARFTAINGLTVSAAEKIYVSDNGTIREIGASGTVTTMAGAAASGAVNGPLTAARFVSPTAVASTAAGVTYVTDIFDHTVRRIAVDGIVSTFAGASGDPGSANGTGSAARFLRPSGVALDAAGNLYIADSGNHTIRRITPGGSVSTYAGTAGVEGSVDGNGAAASFSSPTGVAVDASGNVYVADAGNYLIRKIAPDRTVTTWAGQAGARASVDGVGVAARFLSAVDVAVDAQGNVWVADGMAVRRITPAGQVTTVAGSASSHQEHADGTGARANFYLLTGIAVAPSDGVYVVDGYSHTIRRVTAAGVVTTVAGRAKQFGGVDGRGKSARFNYPVGLSVDAAGNLLIADRENAAVRRIVPGTPPTFEMQPQHATVAQGGEATMEARAAGAGVTYQWSFNGSAMAGATSGSLALADVQPADAGVYRVLATGASAAGWSQAGIAGVATSSKVIGFGRELTPDIVHPNKRIFDQILLEGKAATITADAGQVTRVSYIDLDDDIVQVEFSGPGTLSLVLDGWSGPANPRNYNQDVSYVKGHAGIVITGATEQTNVSVFTVGRATAFDPTNKYDILAEPGPTNDPWDNGSSLFRGHESTAYDGVADIAFIAIVSSNGNFGGVRTSNASYFAAKGLTGVYAPGVAFHGPLYVGDIVAFDAATPVLQVGSVADARITGGDLFQDNGEAIQVSGIAQLKFTAGGDSQGAVLTAKTNQAVFEEVGVEVTAEIVVNP